MTFNSKFKDFFTHILLLWGKANLRDFPWRFSDNIYEVLISEYLLKKTNAEKVAPIYKKYIVKYPDLSSLHKSDVKYLIEILKPLGLVNQRTRMLKQMASRIIEEYHEIIPTEFNELKTLPGVGDYTAAATLCFTFNQCRPIVDVNVIRLFQRFFGYMSEKKTVSSDPEIWKLARELLPTQGCRRFNYGLLDFSHAICKFSNPLCGICPLEQKCVYYRGWKNCI